MSQSNDASPDLVIPSTTDCGLCVLPNGPGPERRRGDRRKGYDDRQSQDYGRCSRSGFERRRGQRLDSPLAGYIAPGSGNDLSLSSS